VENGQQAYIWLKLNNLVDRDIINRLYKASQAGVKIRIIARGMFSLIPGIEGMSENIEAISIIDRFLEHSRIFIFCNEGEEKYYISSADLMPRNLDRRIEVVCPIYDHSIQQELKQYFICQWQDNVKARVYDEQLSNRFRQNKHNKTVRAQMDID
jgi:polyphosphate kinase